MKLRAQVFNLLAACCVLLVFSCAIVPGSAARLPTPDDATVACLRSSGLPEGFAPRTKSGMTLVPAGSVVLGSQGGYADEAPSGEKIAIAAFWIDRTEVTNAQFSEFVKATGYVTDAEREGASAVFKAPRKSDRSRRDGDWWQWIPGAQWRMPEGPSSAARAQPNEPVVQVTQHDALAYAKWMGRDLPSEAEWEYAAAGGGRQELVDRQPRDPKGRPVANYWQGIFPDVNTKEDGFVALAPVGCFPKNGYGLADMIGNAWELTRDRYTGGHQAHGNGDPWQTARSAGAKTHDSERLVIKGGSFLCAENYCMRYRVTAREAQEADLATSHVGFRTVLSVGAAPSAR